MNPSEVPISILLECMERKILCLKSFHKICGEFLDLISKGDIAGLDDFQRRRQSIIKILESLENEIISFYNAYRHAQPQLDLVMTPSVKEKIALLLSTKDSLINAILDLDSQILVHINRLKGETIQKLQSVQMGKKTITAYKSPQERVEALENNNKILDKKA